MHLLFYFWALQAMIPRALPPGQEAYNMPSDKMHETVQDGIGFFVFRTTLQWRAYLRKPQQICDPDAQF